MLPQFYSCFKFYSLILHRKLYSLQTHHVDFTLKRRGNGRFYVVSTLNPRGVFIVPLTSSYSFPQLTIFITPVLNSSACHGQENWFHSHLLIHVYAPPFLKNVSLLHFKNFHVLQLVLYVKLLLNLLSLVI